MRRSILVLTVLGLAIAAGAGLYLTYAADREYVRQIAVGDEAAAEGHLLRAVEAYSGAIALRPDSMLAHLKRGRTYRERGDLEWAARDLRRATELDPTATLPLELLGETYLSLRRYDRAAERFRAYLALDDRSPAVWYKLGLALYRRGRPAEAIDPLERALALDTSLAEAHLLLGLCLRDTNRLELARASLEEATRLAPGLTSPREALAGVYAALGENLRAIDQLEALAALDPASVDRFVALGAAHARARRYEAAVLTLGRAVERFPNAPEVYGALGRVWLDLAAAQDDPISLKKAIEALTTAAAHPDVRSAELTDLGRAWLRAGDTAAAERAFSEAVSRMPVDPEAYLQLAALVARERPREARDALVRYAALVGDVKPLAHVATQIADYSLRIGEAGTALRWIDRAVDEAGETPRLAALRRRAAAARAR